MQNRNSITKKMHSLLDSLEIYRMNYLYCIYISMCINCNFHNHCVFQIYF